MSQTAIREVSEVGASVASLSEPPKQEKTHSAAYVDRLARIKAASNRTARERRRAALREH